jgi:hypothetical protein
MFTKERTTMLDLQKPLGIFTQHNTFLTTAQYRFTTKTGIIVVETDSGYIYSCHKDGRCVGSSQKLANTIPDWEKAFGQYKLEEPEDCTEDYIFQRGFEAGRNWK